MTPGATGRLRPVRISRAVRTGGQATRGTRRRCATPSPALTGGPKLGGWGPARGTRAAVPSAGRGLGLSARRSGRRIHGLEGEVVEPDRPGEDPAVLVDHGDGVASRQRPGATRCVGADLVEVDDPEARQWVFEGGYVRVAAASDARVDGDGRREPGVDREIDRLQCGLVGEEVVRRAGRVGVEAQGAADYVAGADRQVDQPDTLCPDLAGDVLRGVDGHLDVDVEEAETDEGMEVVDGVERAGDESALL